MAEGQPSVRGPPRAVAPKHRRGDGESMSWVVGKLWGFCNTLRHDGIGYGDYIEQLTYLLFLKLAEEKGVRIPEEYDWNSLRIRTGTALLDHYVEGLRHLAKETGLLGDIFAGSLSKFRDPV